jgi:nitrate reductase NapE component
MIRDNLKTDKDKNNDSVKTKHEIEIIDFMVIAVGIVILISMFYS